MTLAEIEANKLTQYTKHEWRPVNDPDICGLYLISDSGEIYGMKRHRTIAKRKFGKCQSEYVELTLRDGRKFFQVKELMLRTFPELYPNNSDQEWKTVLIEDEESAYEVNDCGQVRRRNNHRIVKPAPHRDGYLFVRLRHNGKTVSEYIHRIVAMAFIPNPHNYDVVNHIDEDRTNNSVINLEWCDKSYNFYYSYNRRKGESNGKSRHRLPQG